MQSICNNEHIISPYFLLSETSETPCDCAKTNKGEQLPALADETSVSRCMV